MTTAGIPWQDADLATVIYRRVGRKRFTYHDIRDTCHPSRVQHWASMGGVRIVGRINIRYTTRNSRRVNVYQFDPAAVKRIEAWIEREAVHGT